MHDSWFRRARVAPWMALGVALLLTLAACGGGGGGGGVNPPPPGDDDDDVVTPPPGAPTIEATLPAANAIDVTVGTIIQVEFSEAMDAASTQAAFSTEPATTCTFAWDATNELITCTPTAELTANTTYTVTIAATAESASGTATGVPYTFRFTTAAPIEADATCVFSAADDGNASRFGACRFGP